MRAEMLKVRSMPTPLWCLIAVLLCFVLGLIGTILWGPGEDAGSIDVAIGIPTFIAAVVFGVWIVGVEFGQSTLRQVLTADPRRGRLILVKLAVLLFWVALVTILLHLVAFPLYELASQRHDQSIDAEIVARYGLAALISNVVYAVVGFAFALITASMAGGVTMALVFIFVIDTVISSIRQISDYAMGPALSGLTDNIRGFQTVIFGEKTPNAGADELALVLAWLALLMLLGILRFRNSEIK